MDKSISQPYVNVGSATNSGFSYISRKENDETSGTAFILNRAGGGEPILVIWPLPNVLHSSLFYEKQDNIYENFVFYYSEVSMR